VFETAAGFAGGEFAGGGGNKRRSGNRKLSVPGRMFLSQTAFSQTFRGQFLNVFIKIQEKTGYFEKN